ncbi:hypothetical protein HPT25_09355 [Bacillus sp. BRMEA1]|uniref:hypothetical protein n=1 Tax=Neobacillus endophyticus TaxID=2738405 RepID=UPI001567BE0F|nr:hypothetical protein [Neobacillus endophyticus]NRD77653.1 hypothetical protein [Neobacillus endophyticus]
MQNESKKFYLNRFITAVLSVLMLGVAYLLYTQFISDTEFLTDTAVVLSWIFAISSLLTGIACLIKIFDPRPVVEMRAEGMVIRNFLTAVFVPWHEVERINQQRYTNIVVNPAGFAFVRTTILRVYRYGKRSIAINLLLINKRGDEFSNTLTQHLVPFSKVSGEDLK